MKIFGSATLCVVLLLCSQLALAQSASLSSPNAYEGQRIQQVNITCVTAPDLVRLVEKHVTIQAGDRFSQARIREIIRNIYKLGRFSQVVVEAENVEDGVKLVICPVQIRTIASLSFSGNQSFSANTLREVLGLNIGDGLPSTDPAYLTQPLVTFYRDHGFRQVQIQAQISETSAGTGVALTFVIQEGIPGKIGTISFEGQTLFTEEELIDISALRSGNTFNLDVLDQGIERIQAAYAEKSYFYAAVVAQDVAYNPETGRTDVALTLDEGPQATIRFAGNTQVVAKTLKKLLEITSANDLSDTALQEHVDTLVAWYQEKGYHFIDVSVEKSEKPGQVLIAFAVDEGPRVKVQSVTIQGNQAIATKTLKQVILTDTGGWFSGGWYREQVFDEDLLAIKALYEQQGYLEAEIVTVSREFSPDRTQVALKIVVAEGVQTRITEVQIVGEDDENRLSRVRKLNLLEEGEPLRLSEVNATVSRMRNYYNNQGYLDANVDVLTAFNEDNSQVRVTIQLSAGQQFFVGNISIQGVVNTKKHFITRELLVKEGDVYNPQKVRDTVRRLRQSGLYDSVTFRRFDSKSNDPVQNMILLVSETSARDIEVGMGYSSAEQAPRGFVEYSDRNILNYGGKGSARAELSLERPKVTLQYIQPHLFTRDTRGVASLFDEFQRDNDSFNVERRGGRLAVHHTFDPTLSMSVGYLFEQADPSNVRQVARLSPYDTDVVNLGGLDAQVLWDFRDDLLQPRKGGLNQVYLRMTSKTLLAEAEFFEAQVQSNWYWRVLGDMVVACALNGKMIEPARSSEQVPIYTRYFLGGDNTVRGFKKHEIGPVALSDDGSQVRVGGNRLFRGSAEVRFPIYGIFGGVIFCDAGANWLNDDGFQAEYIREGAGVGLRVTTPIGPLRVDYGWKLDREAGESAGEFYLTIGSAF